MQLKLKMTLISLHRNKKNSQFYSLKTKTSLFFSLNQFQLSTLINFSLTSSRTFIWDPSNERRWSFRSQPDDRHHQSLEQTKHNSTDNVENVMTIHDESWNANCKPPSQQRRPEEKWHWIQNDEEERNERRARCMAWWETVHVWPNAEWIVVDRWPTTSCDCYKVEIVSFRTTNNLLSSFSPLMIATANMSTISAINKFTSISCSALLFIRYVNAISPASQTTPWHDHSRNLQCRLKLRTWSKLSRYETNFFVISTSFLSSFFSGSGTILFSPSRRVSEFI